MGEERQLKRIFKAKMQRRRLEGRPRTRRKDVLLRDLERSELSVKEAVTEDLHRNRWRTILRPSCEFNAAGSYVK